MIEWQWQAQVIHTKPYVEPKIIVKFVTSPHAPKLIDTVIGNNITICWYWDLSLTLVSN